MRIFGYSLVKEDEIRERIKKEVKVAERSAISTHEFQTKNQLYKKFEKANVVITKIRLITEPEYDVYVNHYGAATWLPDIEYEVTFRFNYSKNESTIILNFDDYDVSISDLQRAIQAKICGKERGCDGEK